MRVLLINPRQRASLYSWTEVAHITGCSGYMPNLALPTLAALAPPGVDVTLVDEVVEPVEQHLQGRWDVVGITGYVTQRSRMIELAELFRAHGHLVAIGGPYATLSASTLRPHADVLFVGEAEETWPQFLSDYAKGSWHSEYRTPRTVDLATSPMPASGKLRNSSYFVGVVQTSRGCPFECEFCDVIVYLGRKQRHKPPLRVVRELENLHTLGYRNVFLADDNFTVHRRKASAIVTAISGWNATKSEPIALATQLSIDIVRTPELLDQCVRAGLRQAFVGIETSSLPALREVKKRQNMRPDLIADIRELQRRGLAIQAGMIVGFDSDTTDCFRQQFDFLQRAGLAIVLVNALLAPEGTPLESRLMSENRVVPMAAEDGCLETNIIPKQMSTAELQLGMRWLLNKLFDPDAFLERLAVLADNSPVLPQSQGWGSARHAVIWQNLRRAYKQLGSRFETVPRRAAELFRRKDGYTLVTSLVFHHHVLQVLQKRGLWHPALAQASDPPFQHAAQ